MSSRRAGLLVLALGLVLGVACVSPPPESPQPQTPPEAPAPKMPAPEPNDPAPAKLGERVEALALACDGAALTELGPEAIAALQPDDTTTSASLLALWERERRFEDGAIVPASVDAFVPALAAALDMQPPAWWVDTLKSARGGPNIATGYDLGLVDGGDRRGPLRPGPGGVLVRPGLPVALSGSALAFDLSMGRVELMPVPERPGTALEVARAHAGSTLYVAAFEPSVGGFRFPLRAVGSDGKERWSTEVCAADRKVLGGHGAMIVEVDVIEDPPPNPRVKSMPRPHGIAVFTAETHGVTVEVFDLEGRRTLAWSSDLWSWRG